MCGILVFLDKLKSLDYELYLKLFEKINPRGPESTQLKEYIYSDYHLLFGFQRLRVNDASDLGNQPFETMTSVGSDILSSSVTNGEIYNHKFLEEKHRLVEHLTSKSDCEVILRMYNQSFDSPLRKILRTIQELDGEFAGVMMEKDDNKLYLHAYRDPFGVRPLYYGISETGYGFSSELKGLVGAFDEIKQFPPGQILTLIVDGDHVEEVWQTFYHRKYPVKVFDEKEALIGIRTKLEEAVVKRKMSDRPVCCLLSGGLDSSLMASILAKHSKEKIHTFCVGMEGGEDFKYARMVAEHIGSIHHEIVLTEKDFLDALPEVVRVIETYDGTTCRASTGQYLVSKYIKEKTDFRVVYVGEGSDELTGGYLYFHNAPDEVAFDKECKRLLKDIHYFDGKRSDRAVSHFGLETRVSFLDKDFVDYYLSIDPKLRYHKMHGTIEKYLLRKAFDKEMNEEGYQYLPDEVLWRKKEAFSDGVSSKKKSWYEIVQEFVASEIGEEYEEMRKSYGYYLMPYSMELYYYRKIFESHYPKCELVLPYFWLPKWCGNVTEASARVLKVYHE